MESYFVLLSSDAVLPIASRILFLSCRVLPIARWILVFLLSTVGANCSSSAVVANCSLSSVVTTHVHGHNILGHMHIR